MLKKLLHYDLKSVFRYWWIAAIASVGLSLAGGLAISITQTDKDVPTLIAMLVIFAIIFAIIGIVAFPIFSYIMVYVRFYKNFFTDEGYLTFTLPVKRSQLLNSKLITSILAMAASAAVIVLDIVILFAVGAGKSFYEELLVPMARELLELFAKMSGLDYMYMFFVTIEILLLSILSLAFSSLFIFACITFAAVITKKAKVITAIGIYYVANGAISGFMQLILLFGTSAISNQLTSLPDGLTDPIVTIMIFAVVLVFALACMLLYVLNYFMIDRKLNLA